MEVRELPFVRYRKRSLVFKHRRTRVDPATVKDDDGANGVPAMTHQTLPHHTLRFVLLVPIAAAALIAPALAQDLGTNFKDKQVRLIVGSAPGGGYDAYGRLLATHMRRHIPGNPTIVVQNMPGAGSLVLANYLANVAPKDGTAFGAVNALIATDPLMYPERVKFD